MNIKRYCRSYINNAISTNSSSCEVVCKLHKLVQATLKQLLKCCGVILALLVTLYTVQISPVKDISRDNKNINNNL